MFAALVRTAHRVDDRAGLSAAFNGEVDNSRANSQLADVLLELGPHGKKRDTVPPKPVDDGDFLRDAAVDVPTSAFR